MTSYEYDPEYVVPVPATSPFTVSLCSLIIGESGAGKSWLGDTVPGPRLVLDAENGTQWTPSQPKVLWDPMREYPPDNTSGQLETVRVQVRDFTTVLKIYEWLNSGQHPFTSVVFDSLTEIQKRCMDNITGVDLPRRQDWGDMLRQMEGLIRQYRDLTMHPIKPMTNVTFITTVMADDSGVRRPNLQGALRLTLPQFVDVVGHLEVKTAQDGSLVRGLMVQPYPGYVAKDRTDRLGGYVWYPNLTQMMEVING